MQQNDDNKKAFTDKAKTVDDKKAENIRDWQNEHGQPTNEFLQKLADDGSYGAIEKLKAIATDLDVSFGPNTSIEELIGRIREATRSDNRVTS